MRTLIVLAVALVASGALVAGTASAKGPFRIEVSGGGLDSPIVLEGPFAVETVFLHDAVAAAPPEKLEPAYTVKLTPEQPDGETDEYPVLMTLTYFPGDGDSPALLRGAWDDGVRYFEASESFQAALDEAIGARTRDAGGDDDALSYVAPGLATAGLVLIGGLVGLRGRLRR